MSFESPSVQYSPVSGAPMDADDVDPMASDFTYAFLAGIDTTSPNRPRTITIPDSDLCKMAGMERQYWDIKAAYFDVVIFFKKGKFYELYDSDAVISSKEFGLKMTADSTNRGKMRMTGVPEQSFAEWSRLFVFRGYKVGRVEQMSRDEDEDNKKGPKIVPRELVQILTSGTVTDPAMISGDGAIYVAALTPNITCQRIDAVAVDMSRGVILTCPCTGVTSDDMLDAVHALLLHLSPREIVLPADASVVELVNNANNKDDDVLLGHLRQFITRGYASQATCAVEALLPCMLKAYKSTGRSPGATPAQQVLAAYLGYLRLNPLDFGTAQLFTDHTGITPPVTTPRTGEDPLTFERRHDQGLFLDATAIENIELVANLRDGGVSSSLYSLLCRATTPGGRRLMRAWLLRPLSNATCIVARQLAVRKDVMDGGLYELWGEHCGATFGSGRKRPRDSGSAGSSPSSPRTAGDDNSMHLLFSVDLERQLSRLAELRSENTRIAFVDPLVRYRSNFDLVFSTLNAFEAMSRLAELCHQHLASAGATATPITQQLLAMMSAAGPAVAKIFSTIDREAAMSSQQVLPTPGMIPAYDTALARIDELDRRFASALDEYATIFNVAKSCLSYASLGKEDFLLEVPIVPFEKARQRLPKGAFEERTRTTKAVKLVCANIAAEVEEYKECVATRANGLVLVLRHMAGQLCDAFTTLFDASSAFSYLDCLVSLASTAKTLNGEHCFPTIIDDNGPSTIEAKQVYHPMLGRPVPNDLTMGGAGARLLLLTGPNMGGKSTMMRTSALAFLMAQLGGPVCASACVLRPVRRIFTRIGARDAQHRGHSTLFVELKETADICRYADGRSLCLIDELGRGTSTHDGYAIAHATLAYLTESTKADGATAAPPLVLFSTHYHALAMEVQHGSHQEMQLAYMDFLLQPRDRTSNVDQITFLYRMVPGICQRSYGVEVAAAAGIPQPLLVLAQQQSAALARSTTSHQLAAMLRLLKRIGERPHGQGSLAEDQQALADERLLRHKAAVVAAATASAVSS